ncbi:hypothetical protein GCM10027191_25980 [Novilysobacter erysipheiresistens]
MYPIRLGYSTAKERIARLLENGHHAEALVTTVFTVEKTMRRTLRQLVVSAGFTSTIADRIIRNLRGLDAVKNNWDIYDPAHRKLTDLLPQTDWKLFKDSAEMRNKMVHGERVYDLVVCKQQAETTLNALDRTKDSFDREYGYSGWTTTSKRLKSRLHIDPKVQAMVEPPNNSFKPKPLRGSA